MDGELVLQIVLFVWLSYSDEIFGVETGDLGEGIPKFCGKALLDLLDYQNIECLIVFRLLNIILCFSSTLFLVLHKD